jgi:chromosome segregation ATPase
VTPELKMLADLLGAIADPVAARERLDQLSTATDKANAAAEQARAAEAALGETRQHHQAKLDADKEAHRRRLVEMQGELAAELEERARVLAPREAAVRTAEEQIRHERAKLAAEAADARTNHAAAQSALERQRASVRR